MAMNRVKIFKSCNTCKNLLYVAYKYNNRTKKTSTPHDYVCKIDEAIKLNNGMIALQYICDSWCSNDKP